MYFEGKYLALHSVRDDRVRSQIIRDSAENLHHYPNKEGSEQKNNETAECKQKAFEHFSPPSRPALYHTKYRKVKYV